MQHGGDIYTEGILKGKKLIDFSSNINPLGVPKSFTENIHEALENLNRYPDAKYRELKAVLRKYIGNSNILLSDEKLCNKEINIAVEENNIILGNGAAEVIDLVISSFKSIMISTPSFGEYEEDAKKYGLNIIYISSKEDMDYNYERIFRNIEKVDAIILGNPNNPDGKIIDKRQFKNILDYCENNNKKVIIDEAFIEFTGDIHNSFIEYINDYKCLFIIRALTKFYAMPGIRLGFGICNDEEFVESIKEKQNPWNINCFAEVAAKYVLRDKEYIKSSLKWIREEKYFFSEELKKIPFIEKVYRTESNFVLCKLKGIDCERLYRLCMDKQVVIRKCDNFRGLDKNYVRFAIKDRQTNMIFINILNNIWRDL